MGASLPISFAGSAIVAIDDRTVLTTLGLDYIGGSPIARYDIIWLDPDTQNWMTLPQQLLFDRTANPVIKIPEGYVQC